MTTPITLRQHLAALVDRYADRPAIIVPSHGSDQQNVAAGFACRASEASNPQQAPQRVIHYRDLLTAPLPVPLFQSTLHTTGSTGAPKAYTYTDDAILANSRALIDAHGYTDRTVFIIAGDMTHLGCWSKLFPTLLAGGTLYILPDGLRQPDDFFRPITENPARQFASFLTPAHLRLLLLYAEPQLRAAAPQLDFIETGGAALPLADQQRLCQLLPDTRLYNTYASTETGVVATYNFNPRPVDGCCGQPLPHAHVSLTADGLIAVEGPAVVAAEHGKPYITSDRGEFDDMGRLFIRGRKDDVIICGGYNIAPVEVEAAAAQCPGVAETLLVPVPHPVLGHATRLLVAMLPGHTLDKRAIARTIADKLERHKVPLYFEQVDHIEHMPNGKVNRRHYCAN